MTSAKYSALGSSPLRLRQAALPDVEAIAEFQTACWREAYRGLVPDAYLDGVSALDRQQRWRDRLVSGARGVALAEVDDGEGDELVGVVSWGSSESGPAPAVELMSLYVAGQRRGTGVAAALLDHAIGAAPARLWVFEENPRALAFYAKHGFIDGLPPTKRADPDTGVRERLLVRG